MAIYKRTTEEKIDLKGAMDKKGMSARKLSQMSGISYSTLHGIINEKFSMNDENRKKLFKVLGLSLKA